MKNVCSKSPLHGEMTKKGEHYFKVMLLNNQAVMNEQKEAASYDSPFCTQPHTFIISYRAQGSLPHACFPACLRQSYW